MNRTIGYCFLLIALLSSRLSKADFVDCPSTQQFASCIGCWQYSSNYPIQCVCPATDFSLVGRCFAGYYPCAKSFMELLYNPAYTTFNIWNSTVQPFWEKFFADAQNQTTTPTTIPEILNNYNFSGMNLTLMRGWTQAYYLYLIYENQTTSWNASKKASVIYEAVTIAQNLIGAKTILKWYQMGNMTNSKLNKNLAYDEFFQFIRLRAKLLVPCHSCKDMYGPLKNGIKVSCTKCPPQCKNCSRNASKCGGCSFGNYLTAQFTCLPCSVGNCAACTSSQCTQCYDSETLKGGQCVDCNGDLGCGSCKPQLPDICTVCNPLEYSYTPNGSGQCYSCNQPQCFACNSTTPSACLSCTYGYYMDSASLCQPCTANCTQCSNSTNCQVCFYGFGLINGVCKACKSAGCLSCDYDLTACSSCVAPYFQFNSTTMTCYIIRPTAAVFSYIYQTAECRPGCDYCYDNNTELCFSCHSRYYMENRVCKKCMPGCLQCQKAQTCKLCVSGYTLSNLQCVRCPSNCRLCNSTNITQCLDCRHGYYMDGTVCKQIQQPQCFLFDVKDNQKCLTCMPGYTLNSEYKCIQCQTSCQYSCNPKNISECRKSRFEQIAVLSYMHKFKTEGCFLEVQGNCQIPEEGWELYYASENQIKVRWDCLYPCKTCNYSQCLTCETGYTYLNGKCYIDLSCNPKCTQCLAGSFRNTTSNACVLCSVHNCGACLEGTCLECFEGYYLQGQFCRPCPEKCGRCYDGTNCNTCAQGYLWPLEMFEYSYDCVKCSQNCKTCKFEPVLCTTCNQGMILANFRCIEQYHVAFKYILNYKYSQFLSGQKSQTLIKQIMNITKAKYSQVFIKNISSGSTVVQGLVSAMNSTAALQKYSALKSTTIQSFQVQGSSIAYVNQTVVVKCSSSGAADCPTGTQDSSKVGIIVGVILAVVALAVIIVVAVICIRKRNRTSTPGSDIDLQSNSGSSSKVGQYDGLAPSSASDLDKK